MAIVNNNPYLKLAVTCTVFDFLIIFFYIVSLISLQGEFLNPHTWSEGLLFLLFLLFAFPLTLVSFVLWALAIYRRIKNRIENTTETPSLNTSRSQFPSVRFYFGLSFTCIVLAVANSILSGSVIGSSLVLFLFAVLSAAFGFKETKINKI